MSGMVVQTDYFESTKELRDKKAYGNTMAEKLFKNLGLNIIDEKKACYIIVFFSFSYLFIIIFFPIYYNLSWPDKNYNKWDSAKNTTKILGNSFTFTSKSQKEDVYNAWISAGVYLFIMGILSIVYLYNVRVLTANRNRMQLNPKINFLDFDSPEIIGCLLPCLALILAGMFFMVIAGNFDYNSPVTQVDIVITGNGENPVQYSNGGDYINVESGLTEGKAVQFIDSDRNYIVCGVGLSSGDSIYCSSNKGKTLASCNNGADFEICHDLSKTTADATTTTTIVAVGKGNKQIIKTINSGETWTDSTGVCFDIAAYSVEYGLCGSTERWVAVGQTTTNTHNIIYSDDGNVWNNTTGTCFDVLGYSVAYGDGKWIAVGSGSNKILKSENGINWEPTGTTTYFNHQGTRIKYITNNGSGYKWFSTGIDSDKNKKLLASIDAEAWTRLGENSTLPYVLNDVSYYTPSGEDDILLGISTWIAVGSYRNSSHSINITKTWSYDENSNSDKTGTINAVDTITQL